MTNRFELMGDSVFDHDTGLEWEAKVSGPMTWHKAMKYAEKLGDGWRLPTIEELSGLVDYNRADPASSFPEMPTYFFWSSSSVAGSASDAWYVHFRHHGFVSNFVKTDANYVRCVRGGSKKERGDIDNYIETRLSAVESALTSFAKTANENTDRLVSAVNASSEAQKDALMRVAMVPREADEAVRSA